MQVTVFIMSTRTIYFKLAYDLDYWLFSGECIITLNHLISEITEIILRTLVLTNESKEKELK